LKLALHAQGQQTRKGQHANQTSRTPFYPPPNKTNIDGVSEKLSGKHALRQPPLQHGAAAAHRNGPLSSGTTRGLASNKDVWGVVDMIPVELEDHLTDLHAKVGYYESKIENLNSTVTDLRDDLDLEREVGAKRDADSMAMEAQRARGERAHAEAAAADQAQYEESLRIHAALGGRLPPRRMMPPPPPPGAPLGMLGGPPFPVDPMTGARLAPGPLAQLQLAQEAEHQGVLHDLSALENENRQLREQLGRTDVEMEDMQQKVLHTLQLQQSFESLRTQMKETKGRLQSELEKKHLEVIRKDEEILQLRARSQIIVQSATDVKAATSEAVKEVKRSAAVDLAAANAALASVQAATKQQKKAYKAQISEQKHQLQRLETSLQTMGAELLAKASKIEDMKRRTSAQREAAMMGTEHVDGDLQAAFSVLPDSPPHTPEASINGAAANRMSMGRASMVADGRGSPESDVSEYVAPRPRKRASLVIGTEENMKKAAAAQREQAAHAEVSGQKIGLLEEQLAARVAKVAQMTVQVRSLEEGMIVVKRELVVSKEKIAAVVAEEAEHDQHAAEEKEALENEVAEATSQLKARDAEVENLTSTVEGKVKELTEATTQMGAMKTKLEEATKELETKNEEIEALKYRVAEMEHAAAQKDVLLLSLEQNVVLLKTEIEEMKLGAVRMEDRAREQITRLEVEMHKAAEMTESIECLRREDKRVAEQRLWDMKEQLEYSNTSRRSLQNYVGYVKDAYRDVFERPGL
jgi:chromosome segregation ATPase